MDALDKAILVCLSENSRMTASAIGKRVRLSVSSFTERIKKLEESNIKPVRKVKAHSFDYRNISSKVKAEEALIWAIMDLENNKLLLSELIEEKAESFLKIRNEG